MNTNRRKFIKTTAITAGMIGIGAVTGLHYLHAQNVTPKDMYIKADNDEPVYAGWGIVKKLTALNKVDNSPLPVSWSSSDEAVAFVRNGYVTAVKEGAATISAKTADGKVATYTVTVSPTPRKKLSDGARKVRCEGAKLVVGPDKKPLFVNGTNTAWYGLWDGFGLSRWDANAWDKHFAELHEAGINMTRIWMICSGTEMQYDELGYCIGMNSVFWDNADKLFEIAERHEVYIMATMCSHNCFLSRNARSSEWLKMRDDNDYMDAYIGNFLIPFANRYGSNDYFASIDLMNEPHQAGNSKSPARIEWRKFFARTIVALHKEFEKGVADGRFIDVIPITVGMDQANQVRGGQNDYTSDANMAEQVPPADSKYARIDLYQFHYYTCWHETGDAPFFGNPCVHTPVQFGFPDAANRPAIMGEAPSKGTGYSGRDKRGAEWVQSARFPDRSIVNDYLDCLNNGWAGYMGWTSFTCDGFGTLTDQAPGTLYMVKHHPKLVFPVDTKITVCQGLFDTLPVNTGNNPTLSPPENFAKYALEDVSNGHLKGKNIRNGHIIHL